MNCYILIHGAWHTSQCWSKLIPMLQTSGDLVLAPDLPGHGNNKASFSEISLHTYVDHVISIVEKQSAPVILVGHSMAGMVISQVAELIPQKIAHLVFVAGFVPSHLHSLTHAMSQCQDQSIAKAVMIDRQKNEILLDPTKPIKQYFYGDCDDREAIEALRHLQAQPLRPFKDIVKISEAFSSVKKLYIECLRDNVLAIDDQRKMHSKIHCRVESLNTDHSPFFSAPSELAGILLNIIDNR